MIDFLCKVIEVAETVSLIDRALRRVRGRFRDQVDASTLEKLPGVSVLSRDTCGEMMLQVAGEMDGLIKALGTFPVRDFETHRPSLEEAFLAYYE